MLIEWHILDGKAEVYTLHRRCCDKWDDNFEYYVNYQPHGLFLEVPTRMDIIFTEPYHGADAEDEPLIHWKRIGKIEWCPFCGARISMYKTNVDSNCDHSDAMYEPLNLNCEQCKRCGHIRVIR